MVTRSLKAVSRGFTLIELLVVIAIIGLLAAVVLASVGSARNKGVDASVKAGLDGMRSQAELYASNHSNSYAGVCTATASQNGLAAMLSGAATSTGATVVNNAAGGYNKVGCNDAATTWVVQAPVSGSASGAGNGKYWCVDSSGASIGDVTDLTAAATACPTP